MVVVSKYEERGLSFGTPSGGRQIYEHSDQVPLPLRLVGRSVDFYEELENELGVTLRPSEIYGDAYHKGVKRLVNPNSGVEYEFAIELWDTDLLAKLTI